VYCSTETKLVDEFAEAAANYFGAVSELSAAVAGSRDGLPPFYDCYRRARREHDNCERARRAVERHRLEHHCQKSAALLLT
jgi:hypothetical protein